MPGTSHIPLQPKEQTERDLALLYSLLDACPEAMWLRDADGMHVYLNDAARRFGVNPGDMLHHQGPKGFSREMIARAAEDDQTVLATGEPLSRTIAVPETIGRARVMQVTKFPIVCPTGQKLVGAIAVDVTELAGRVSELESVIQPKAA